MRIFKNAKSILIRKIFERDNYKISNKSTIEATTRILNIYRLTFDNNNTSIMRF